MNKKLIISFIAVGLLLTACGNSKSTTVKIKTTPTPAAGVIITDSSTSSDILGTLPAHSVISYFTGLDKTTNNALVAEFTSSNCIETGVQFKNYPTYSMVPLGIDTKAFDFLSKYKYVNYQSTASDFWVKDGMSTTAKFVKDDSYKGKMLPVFADLESLYGSSAPTVCNIFAGLKAKLEPTIVPFDDTYNFEDKANAQKQIADPKNKDKIKVYVASFDSLKNTGTKLEGAKVMFWIGAATPGADRLGGVIIYDKDGKTLATFTSISALPAKLEVAVTN